MHARDRGLLGAGAVPQAVDDDEREPAAPVLVDPGIAALGLPGFRDRETPHFQSRDRSPAHGRGRHGGEDGGALPLAGVDIEVRGEPPDGPQPGARAARRREAVLQGARHVRDPRCPVEPQHVHGRRPATEQDLPAPRVLHDVRGDLRHDQRQPTHPGRAQKRPAFTPDHRFDGSWDVVLHASRVSHSAA